MHFLKDWLSNHILKTDMAYKPFFAAKGVKVGPASQRSAARLPARWTLRHLNLPPICATGCLRFWQNPVSAWPPIVAL